ISSALEAAIRNLSGNADLYRHQIHELQGKLTEHLGNFRAVDSLLEDALTGLDDHLRRAEGAGLKIPEAHVQLDRTQLELNELSSTLPVTRKQAVQIQNLYDSGRKKAKLLVEDLTWLNTQFYERWRRTIFTSSAPVSTRWTVLLRFLFLLSAMSWVYILWTAFSGIVRAYKHRLLWGERLMS
ncbi:hypothetical protein DL96DRAFT_1458257, partial [Flagelloscypha sp. PMI_526]